MTTNRGARLVLTVGYVVTACVLCALLPSRVVAQTTVMPKSVTVDDLIASTAPAFILLGGEPTTVQRPATAKGFKATLLSAFGEDGSLPDGFALEVTPFWWKPRPSFTVDDYFAAFTTRVVRSASLALATANDDVGDGTSRTNVAVSARTLLLSPNKQGDFDRLRTEIESATGACMALNAPQDAQCLDSLSRSSRVERLRAYIERPTGLTIELSAGVSGSAATEDASTLRWRNFGVWITPTWTINGSLDAIAVARYIRTNGHAIAEPDAGIIDYGARLIWRPVPQVGISAEAVGRRYDEAPQNVEDQTVRYGALLEYALTEKWFLFYSFGKDFAAAEAPRSELLSKIGLSLGIGRSRVVQLDPVR